MRIPYRHCRTLPIDGRSMIKAWYRCTTLLFVWPAAVSPLLGCAQKEPSDVSDEQVSKEVERMTLPKTIQHPDGALELKFGDLMLRIPQQPAYSLSLTPAKESEPGGGSHMIGWTLEWPSLQAWNPPPLVRMHPPDALAAIVRILVQRRTPISGDDKRSSVTRDANWALSEWTRGLSGPYENEALGLVEYRNKTGRPVVYASPEEDLIGLDGQRPFVQCSGSAAVYFGGYRQCQVRGWLSRQVRYRYEFTDKWLKDWPEMERRIQAFLTDRIIDPDPN